MPRYSRKREYEDEGSSEEQVAKPTKKTKKSAGATPLGAGTKAKDAEGNTYWELSAKRRVTASKFNKTLFVNIREYYDADGEMKPGKKGISLSVDQYKALLKAIPGINNELRKDGHDVDDLGDEEAGEELKSPKKKPSKKANIEATSDEDSE